jgi:fumarate reductase flavoprotein subunit
MHGANRLGGNGVANSTVFGGIAGDVMSDWIAENSQRREPDEEILASETVRCTHPFTRKPGDVNRLRERLMDLMWDQVGVVRDAAGIARGLAGLNDLEAELLETGVADGSRAFNLTWHDWMNVRSLIETSRAIALAAQQRENSRGAHFRSDFPEPGDLESSTFTVVRQRAGRLMVSDQPVLFTHVRPGESLRDGKAAAE